MTILFVFQGDYPWDARVEKMCRSLVDAGHEVHLICANQASRRRDESLDGWHVKRMPAFTGRLRRLNGPLSLPVFFNPLWLIVLIKAARAVQPHVLMVRDMPLAVASTTWARLVGLPVVMDMAEDYPAAMADWNRSEPVSFKSLLLRNVAAARLFERLCIRLASHILVVCEENAQRLFDMGVPRWKVTLVGNTCWPGFGAEIEAPSSGRPSLALIYTEEVQKYRGLDTCIRALASLRDAGVAATLAMVGAGPDRPRLEALARALRVDDMVRFIGKVDPVEVPRCLARYDVGLVPHVASEFINTTMPNKLYEYMATGLPVIVSDARPLARLVLEVGCGLVFRSGSHQSLAGVIADMTEPSARREMGRRGQMAVKHKYNWSVDAARMLRVIEHTAAGKPANVARV